MTKIIKTAVFGNLFLAILDKQEILFSSTFAIIIFFILSLKIHTI